MVTYPFSCRRFPKRTSRTQAGTHSALLPLCSDTSPTAFYLPAHPHTVSCLMVLKKKKLALSAAAQFNADTEN